ncbi:hypothetical protein VTN00DRAFT_35 [Thermoascus crustaceus]|uniref:uncharacterized protein n=1 Tax=Thermoascus crustaceus TaxID=5088 RepID=UPI00374428CD
MTDPTPPPPPPPSEPQPPSPTPQKPTSKPRPRLPIKTYHCRFCNHLLLASTRDVHSLPRRSSPASDGALILPLPPKTPSTTSTLSDSESEPEPEGLSPSPTRRKQGKRQEHYTILLSTTLPDRKTTIVRREDGFEKRLLLRCGRCRVVVGYLLDDIHFPRPVREVHDHDQEGDKGNEDDDDEAKVAYLLPGALVQTEEMGDEARKAGMDAEWRGWVKS